MTSRYAFLTDTYETELLKVLSVWAMASEADLDIRPRRGDRRGRTLREHMVHQCQSEHGWFGKMFGINEQREALPAERTRLEFLRHYAAAGQARLEALRARDDGWWEQEAAFFEVSRPRTWIMTRRIAHTAHHRGQQTALLRAMGRALHSTYGPTADTGGLAKDQPPVVYLYESVAALLTGVESAAPGRPLPAAVEWPVTECPDRS